MTPAPLEVTITVGAGEAGTAFDPLILGSNLPNWLSQAQFEDEQFIRRTAASGLTLMRIPGGSFGDEYGWLSCERGEDLPNAFPCLHDFVRRPTDFINFFRRLAAAGSQPEVMFIVNVNVSAQEAAAAVAFFNAPVGDPTLIGVDRNGFDWQTAGTWAALRAEHGNPEPLRIRYWEIGNEVYGGKPGNPGCPGSGWELTWTCLGNEYMLGARDHDGVIQMRAAMLAVDPTIAVGALGVNDVSNWNEQVLTSAPDQIDYFVLHTYAVYPLTGNLGEEQGEILALPQFHFPSLARNTRFALNEHASGRDLPVVVNEYGLIPPYGRDDPRNYMNKQVAALFHADAIGQMLTSGVAMAANWALMNGKSDPYGNEFGLMRADGSNFRQPKYYVYPLWARFGTTLLPLESSADPEDEVSAYAGRLADGTLTVLVINKHRAGATVTLTFDGVTALGAGQMDVLSADALDAADAVFNGVRDPADDLSDAPSTAIPAPGGNRLVLELAPISVTLIRVGTGP